MLRDWIYRIMGVGMVFAFVVFCAMFSAALKQRNGQWRPASQAHAAQGYQYEENEFDLYDRLESFVKSRDANDDGRLSHAEAMADALGGNTRVQLWFEETDSNSDGQVTMFEVAEWLDAMDAREKELDEMFNRLDLNGDGLLTEKEFTVSEGQLALPSFRELDGDWNGSITIGELKRALWMDMSEDANRPRPRRAGNEY